MTYDNPTDALFDKIEQEITLIERQRDLLLDVLESIPAAAVFVVNKDMTILASGGELLGPSGVANLSESGLYNALTTNSEIKSVYKKAITGETVHATVEWRGITYRVVASPLKGKRTGLEGAVAISLEI